MAKIERSVIPNADKDEVARFLYMNDGRLNWQNQFGKTIWQFPIKLNIFLSLTHQSLDFHPIETKTCIQKRLYMKVYDCPKPGKKCKGLSKNRMYKQILVYSCHGILFNKKEWATDTCTT